MGTETDQLLTAAQVADMLQLQARTLMEWRLLSKGPKWFRLGDKAIRYRRSDLEAWIASQEPT